MIRMLIVGYGMGIRSGRRLCEEVHLNLAYCWFCRLGLNGKVPDHSTFSRNRHGRFRDSDILRRLFESIVERCLAEKLVGGGEKRQDASPRDLIFDIPHLIETDLKTMTLGGAT
jgi:transposase